MSAPDKMPSRIGIFQTTLGKVGIGISIVLVGAGLAPILFVSAKDGSFWLQNLGNLGQYLSGLFAPVAFIWVVIAVILQGRELELQREELKDTREVLNLQREEMKRAADETREQTRIMTENLLSESQRQVYSEVDIILYSLALYIVSNYTRSIIRIASDATYIVDASKLYESINKENSDRVYLRLHNSLFGAAAWLRQRPNQSFQLSAEGREFISYLHAALSQLTKESKIVQSELAKVRLKALQISESFALLDEIKRAVIGA